MWRIPNPHEIEQMKSDISDLKIQSAETKVYLSKCDQHEREIAELKAHRLSCDSQHETHNRRHSDTFDVQAKQAELLGQILKKITDYEPTLKRSSNNYTTVDTILRWAGGSTVIIVFVSGIFGLITLIRDFI